MFSVVRGDTIFHFKSAKHAAIFFAYYETYEIIVDNKKIGTIGNEEEDLLKAKEDKILRD